MRIRNVMYMAIRKYADVPAKDVNVVSPKGHQEIEENLHRLGVKTAKSVAPNERKDALASK